MRQDRRGVLRRHCVLRGRQLHRREAADDGDRAHSGGGEDGWVPGVHYSTGVDISVGWSLGPLLRRDIILMRGLAALGLITRWTHNLFDTQ